MPMPNDGSHSTFSSNAISVPAYELSARPLWVDIRCWEFCGS
jgi:hypothetical protein